MLAALLPGKAAAQVLEQYDYEDLEFRGIGVEASRVWPSKVEPTTGFGLLLDLGFVGPRVRITPVARYWASSLEQEEIDRLGEQIVLVCERQGTVTCPSSLDLGEVKLSDLELTTEAHYLPLILDGLSVYVGLGLSLHLLNGRGDFIDGTFVEDLLDTVAPGVGGIVGASARLGPAFTFGAQARYMLASEVRYGLATLSAMWTLPGPRPSSAIRAAPPLPVSGHPTPSTTPSP